MRQGFSGIPFPDRPSQLYGFWEGELPLEMLCCTPEEFGRKRRAIGVVRDTMVEGVTLIGGEY